MSLNDSRPKTKKLRNATPNINLPIINSSSNKFNWKNLSESNVYILKKLPEVSLKDCSLNELDQIEFNSNDKWLNELIDLRNELRNELRTELRTELNSELRNELKNELRNDLKSNQQKKWSKNNKKEFIKQNSSIANSDYLRYRSPSEYSVVKIKCYLCNNEFNAKQIIKHETECLDKWRKLSSEEKRKAIEAQKDWLNSTLNKTNAEELNLEISNQQTGSQWKQRFKFILRSCSKCGKKFFDHRLKKHELNCKGKQVLSKLDERAVDNLISETNDKRNFSNKNQQENIVFVRKTKPLNSRSTQFYRQQHASLPLVSNQSKMNAQSLFNTQQETSNLTEQSKLEQSSSNDSEKNSLINQQSNKTTINYFAKCSQCGRVLNRANLETHEKYHARSNNLINQSIDDNLKDKFNTIDVNAAEKTLNELTKNNLSEDTNRDTNKNMNGNMNRDMNKSNLSNSKGINDAIKYENSIKRDEQNMKSELIAQLNNQFNQLTNQTDAINRLNSVSQTKSIEELISDPDDLMFNDEEWNEHLLNLKKCSKCNRSFFANRIKKHQTICKAKKNHPL